MRLRFLVNPTSGGRRGGRLLRLVRRRAAVHGGEVHVSCSGADLTAQARRAVEEGVERLVVAGGDGTVHLAVQAVAGSPCELAVLPSGRGDDFAVSVGVPRGLEPALKLALSGRSREIDLGRAGEIWFDAYAGGGLDSAVTARAETHPRWLPSSLTYVLATLRVLARFRAPRVRAEHDGGTFEGRAMFVTACNAPFFGGGMKIAPDALMDDGLLDLVIVREVSKAELLRVFPRVFGGKHVDHPAVEIVRTRGVRLSTQPDTLLGSDGEILGSLTTDPVEITIRPRALRVVVPSPTPRTRPPGRAAARFPS